MRILLALLALSAPALAKKPKKVPVATPEAPAQPEETVELPCGYTPGEVHRYSIEKRSERREPGRAPVVQGESVVVDLTVVAHEGAQTTLDVAFSGHHMLAPPEDPAMRRLLERVAEVSSGVPVRLEVDHEASTSRVVDIEALMTAYRRLADEMKVVLREEVPGANDALLASVDAALADGDLAAASITADLQPLFGFTCGKVPVGEVRYQTALPNPLGRTPLPASGAITGVVERGTVSFTIHEVLDPVKVMDQLRPLMQQMGVQLPDDAGLERLEIEIATDVRVVVDRANGWPTGWTSARTASALGSGRVETVTVTRL